MTLAAYDVPSNAIGLKAVTQGADGGAIAARPKRISRLIAVSCGTECPQAPSVVAAIRKKEKCMAMKRTTNRNRSTNAALEAFLRPMNQIAQMQFRGCIRLLLLVRGRVWSTAQMSDRHSASADASQLAGFVKSTPILGDCGRHDVPNQRWAPGHARFTHRTRPWTTRSCFR